MAEFDCPDCDWVPKEGGKRPDVSLRIHRKYHHALEGGDSEAPVVNPSDGSSVPPTLEPESPPPDPPKRRQKTVREVARQFVRGKSGDANGQAPKAEPTQKPPQSKRWGKSKPGRKPGRVSTAGLVSMGYSFLGARLIGSGQQVALGKALTFQAGIAGPEIDRLIKGTIVDPFIQPVAKLAGTGEDVAKIAAFPGLVFAFDNFPTMRGLLDAPMRSAIKANCVEIAKEARKMREEEDRIQAEFEAAMPDLYPDGQPPVDAQGRRIDLVSSIMFDLFGPPEVVSNGNIVTEDEPASPRDHSETAGSV